MRAQDFMNQDNDRAFIVNQLIQYCTERGLDYSFTAKRFVIPLPQPELISVTNPSRAKIKRIGDTPMWDLTPNPEGDTEQTDLPPIDKPLEDGETPPETELK